MGDDSVGDSDAGLSKVAVNNCDQRSPFVSIEDARLPGGILQLEQRGATSDGFVASTSSVIWATAHRMSRWLINQPELVRDKNVIELGAGIGLVGATAAAMGAKSVVLTDCQPAMPLLQRNSELLASRGIRAQVAKLDWGSHEDEAAAGHLAASSDGLFDLVLACDVVLAGWETKGLIESCARLLRRDPAACFLLAFEFREDWETIGNLLGHAVELGLQEKFVGLLADGTEAADEDDEDEFFLYTLSWR
eukprot:TRINITY_DN9034_c0_g3_i1.p1 TRINITY_DN9034_c0_g3~~TRINITY_DN9034_c0_g3_i1.p1  ORF type:complete len:256 (-),score=58.86 TRINITY_DN9034_c0_g3_i1:62-808(-)